MLEIVGQQATVGQPPLTHTPTQQIDLFGESTRGNLHFASSDEDDRPPASRRRIDDVLGLRWAMHAVLCFVFLQFSAWLRPLRAARLLGFAAWLSSCPHR